MRLGWVFAMLMASLAHAAAPPPEAKEHFAAGDRAFKLGDFQRAVDEYRQSFEMFPAPLILYDIAQAYRMMGDHEKALFSYKQYLVDAPPGEYRKFAEEQVEKLGPVVEEEQKRKAAPPREPAQTDGSGGPEAASPSTAPVTVTAAPVTEEPAHSGHRGAIIGGVVAAAVVVLGVGITVGVLSIPKDAPVKDSMNGSFAVSF